MVNMVPPCSDWDRLLPVLSDVLLQNMTFSYLASLQAHEPSLGNSPIIAWEPGRDAESQLHSLIHSVKYRVNTHFNKIPSDLHV